MGRQVCIYKQPIKCRHPIHEDNGGNNARHRYDKGQEGDSKASLSPVHAEDKWSEDSQYSHGSDNQQDTGGAALRVIFQGSFLLDY